MRGGSSPSRPVEIKKGVVTIVATPKNYRSSLSYRVLLFHAFPPIQKTARSVRKTQTVRFILYHHQRI